MKNEIMKRKKKGFTLVEIIVVLVILAVLAAVTIPSMLGFINEAKGKTEIANARTVYLAGQIAATEKYATTPAESFKASNFTEAEKAVKDRLEGDIATSATYKIDYNEKGHVTKVQFLNNGYLITIDGVSTGAGTTTVSKGGTIVA